MPCMCYICPGYIQCYGAYYPCRCCANRCCPRRCCPVPPKLMNITDAVADEAIEKKEEKEDEKVEKHKNGKRKKVRKKPRKNKKRKKRKEKTTKVEKEAEKAGGDIIDIGVQNKEQTDLTCCPEERIICPQPCTPKLICTKYQKIPCYEGSLRNPCERNYRRCPPKPIPCPQTCFPEYHTPICEKPLTTLSNCDRYYKTTTRACFATHETNTAFGDSKTESVPPFCDAEWRQKMKAYVRKLRLKQLWDQEAFELELSEELRKTRRDSITSPIFSRTIGGSKGPEFRKPRRYYGGSRGQQLRKSRWSYSAGTRAFSRPGTSFHDYYIENEILRPLIPRMEQGKYVQCKECGRFMRVTPSFCLK